MNLSEKALVEWYLQGKTEVQGEKPAHKSNLGLCIENLATAYSIYHVIKSPEKFLYIEGKSIQTF